MVFKRRIKVIKAAIAGTIFVDFVKPYEDKVYDDFSDIFIVLKFELFYFISALFIYWF